MYSFKHACLKSQSRDFFPPVFPYWRGVVRDSGGVWVPTKRSSGVHHTATRRPLLSENVQAQYFRQVCLELYVKMTVIRRDIKYLAGKCKKKRLRKPSVFSTKKSDTFSLPSFSQQIVKIYDVAICRALFPAFIIFMLSVASWGYDIKIGKTMALPSCRFLVSGCYFMRLERSKASLV